MLVKLKYPIQEQDVKDVDVLLSDLEVKVGNITVVQTVDDRAGLPKVRRGADGFIGLVADLAERFGVVVADVSAVSVRSSADYAVRLGGFHPKAQAILTAVEDTRRQAKAEAWDGALTLYRALARFSVGNGQVGAALRPLREFMKRGKRTDEKSPDPSQPSDKDAK